MEREIVKIGSVELYEDEARKLYEEKNFDHPVHYVHGADTVANTGICGQSLLRHLW